MIFNFELFFTEDYIIKFFWTESRSNSTGHVFMHSPSNVFGSLISDTEDFFDDLHSHRGSFGRNAYGSTISSPAFSPTPPFRTNSASKKPEKNALGKYTDEELLNPDRAAGTSKAALQLMALEKRLANEKANGDENKEKL